MSGGEITLFVIVLSGAHGQRTVEQVSAKMPYRKPREPRDPRRPSRRCRGYEDMRGGGFKKKEREICKEKQEMAECREGNAIHLLNLVLTQPSHSRRCTTQVLPPLRYLLIGPHLNVSTRHRYIHACTFQMPFF